MSEQRRQEYLEALGIDQFVPRRRLPAAKPSLALVRLHCADTSTAVSVERSERVEPVKRADSVESADRVERAENTARGESTTRPDSEAKQATAPAHRQSSEIPSGQPTSAPQAAAALVDSVARRLGDQPHAPAKPEAQISGLVPVQKVLRFALTVWHLPGWLWIDSRQSQEALPTDALLHNILYALGLHAPVKAEVINWPPVESPIQSQDWPQAREMLKSFLSPRLGAGERLILLGEAAYNACTDGPFDYQQRLASGAGLSHQDNPRLLLPSLAQILREPTLKAQVWQQLRHV